MQSIRTTHTSTKRYFLNLIIEENKNCYVIVLNLTETNLEIWYLCLMWIVLFLIFYFDLILILYYIILFLFFYIFLIKLGAGLTVDELQIARVSDKAYDAFSRVASKALDFISCIIFKTLLGKIMHNNYIIEVQLNVLFLRLKHTYCK